jgi:hypothetical protein
MSRALTYFEATVVRTITFDKPVARVSRLNCADTICLMARERDGCRGFGGEQKMHQFGCRPYFYVYKVNRGLFFCFTNDFKKKHLNVL